MKWRHEHKAGEILIVGAGAAYGVLAKELSEAGTGPLRDPQKEFASNELSMRSLTWEDTWIIDGTEVFRMGSHNSGRGLPVSIVASVFKAVCLMPNSVH